MSENSLPPNRLSNEALLRTLRYLHHREARVLWSLAFTRLNNFVLPSQSHFTKGNEFT